MMRVYESDLVGHMVFVDLGDEVVMFYDDENVENHGMIERWVLNNMLAARTRLAIVEVSQ